MKLNLPEAPMTATAVLLVDEVERDLAARLAGRWKRENILYLKSYVQNFYAKFPYTPASLKIKSIYMYIIN